MGKISAGNILESSFPANEPQHKPIYIIEQMEDTGESGQLRGGQPRKLLLLN